MENTLAFETAKLAKEKGFNWKVSSFFSDSDKSFYELKEGYKYEPRDYNDAEKGSKLTISAPTQGMLQTWLRDIHNIEVVVTRDIEVHFQNEIRWVVLVNNWNNVKEITTSITVISHPEHLHLIDFKSYESALENGLLTALKEYVK